MRQRSRIYHLEAFLLIAGLLLSRCIPERKVNLPENLYRHVEYLSSDKLLGRKVTSRGDSLARTYIADQFKAYGLYPGNGASYFQEFTYSGDLFHGVSDDSGKIVYNVLGFIPGRDPSQTLVIGAHYDHIGIKHTPGIQDSICNGADDNASGIALLLELARKHGHEDTPDCNLLFISFTAEESGLLGSMYFLRHPPPDIYTIKAALNFDMIGRMQDNRLFINHTNSADFWRDMITIANEESLTIIYDNLNSRNDGVCFTMAQIPVIWFFTGLHEDMHQVTDEIDRLNFAGMVKIFYLADRIVNQLIY